MCINQRGDYGGGKMKDKRIRTSKPISLTIEEFAVSYSMMLFAKNNVGTILKQEFMERTFYPETMVDNVLREMMACGAIEQVNGNTFRFILNEDGQKKK